MKKILIYALLIAVFTCSFLGSTQAQRPPHPNQTSTGGGVTGQRIGEGGGAPIGSGSIILMVLAAAYAGRKTYSLKQQEE